MRERAEALQYLLDHKGDCSRRLCNNCYFRDDQGGCSITLPYRKEQTYLNKVLNRDVRSVWIEIKYTYAKLYYNRIIIDRYTAPKYDDNKSNKYEFIERKK